MNQGTYPRFVLKRHYEMSEEFGWVLPLVVGVLLAMRFLILLFQTNCSWLSLQCSFPMDAYCLLAMPIWLLPRLLCRVTELLRGMPPRKVARRLSTGPILGEFKDMRATWMYNKLKLVGDACLGCRANNITELHIFNKYNHCWFPLNIFA